MLDRQNNDGEACLDRQNNDGEACLDRQNNDGEACLDRQNNDGEACLDRQNNDGEVCLDRQNIASYPGPYTHAVRASFQGGIRAWYPLFCACANLKPMNKIKLRC